MAMFVKKVFFQNNFGWDDTKLNPGKKQKQQQQEQQQNKNENENKNKNKKRTTTTTTTRRRTSARHTQSKYIRTFHHTSNSGKELLSHPGGS